MHARGCSGREIARILEVSRNTVAEYVGKGVFSPEPPVAEAPDRPTMRPYARTVESWLEADVGAPRKQRHTARRASGRLRDEEGLGGSPPAAGRFVREWREAHRGPDAGYLELEWPAGTAQAACGECFADVGGSRERLHALVVSFPHPSARFEVLTRAQRPGNACRALAGTSRATGRARWYS